MSDENLDGIDKDVADAGAPESAAEKMPDKMSDDELKNLLDHSFGTSADDAVKEYEARANAEKQQKTNDFQKNFEQMSKNMPPEMATMVQNFFSSMAANQGGNPGLINRKLAMKIAHDHLFSHSPKNINEQIMANEHDAYVSALRSANLWLDSQTSFIAKDYQYRILRPIDWLDDTMPAWERVISPIVRSTNQQLENTISDQISEIQANMDEMGELDDNHPLKSAIGFNINGFQGMLPIEGDSNALLSTIRSLGSSSAALQIGTAVAHLAMSATDGTGFGIPLFDKANALVPYNIQRFAEEASLPLGDAVNFMALREVASTRLFAGVPWLSGHLLSIVERYADGIYFDMQSMEERMQNLDLDSAENINDMQEKLQNMSGDAFVMENSAEQDAVIEELETTLALIEGWVDLVTFSAGSAHIESIGRLRELMERQRVTGSAGERAFSDLLGLKLRPAKCQEARTIWEKVMYNNRNSESGGIDQRDELWNHPDNLPNARGLEHPELFLSGDKSTTKFGATEHDSENDWSSLLS
jgi:putative hydrolase